jgi:Misato Segment II tubulin-like domain
MKEIQADPGSLGIYVGTHFWNIQENYFTYWLDADGEDYSLVSNNVPFMEGIAYNVSSMKSSLYR